MRKKSLSSPTAITTCCAVLLVSAAADAQAPPAPPASSPPPPAAPPPAAPPSGPVKPLAESLSGMAKAEYEAGKILFADKDFANAIQKFQRAYELSKEPRLLWNIAVCEKNLRKYTRMLTAIQRYRKEAATMLTPEDLANADELVKTVKTFVSEVKLTATEAGADVFIDGEKVATTPVAEALLVDVGKHTIKITKEGYKEFSKAIDVAGGTQMAVAATLIKELHEGKLVIEAGPKDMIFLDGKAVGMGRFEGTVASGGHTLRVSAQGMTPYQTEVVVKDNETRKIPVTLEAAKGSSLLWLWITGGILLTGGAVAAGVLLSKPPAPTELQGTLGSFPTMKVVKW